MAKEEISTTTLHKVPEDLRKVFLSSPKVLAAWNSNTPLARNEWVCWIITVKKAETRTRHLERAREELAGGKRRPCCFSGCPHR